jgi:BatD DUF11 like domain
VFTMSQIDMQRASVIMLIALSLLMLNSPSVAKVASVYASASPDQLELGDSFIYQVTVEGSGTLPTPSNNIPSAFQILSGPNSNVNMQFVNGKMSSSRTLTYTLRALRRGDFTLPAPVVTDKGRQYTGNAIRIVVKEPGNGNTKQSQQPEPGDMVPRGTKVDQGRLEQIFLQADIEPKSVYLQEPLVINFTLYFQPSVRTFDVQKLPSTEGFWSEEWSVPNPPGVVERNINGRLYNAAVIHRLILFPTRTGELTIGPMNLLVHYVSGRSRNRTFFDSIFDNYVEQVAVNSDQLTINVKALPSDGQPDGFENVVGNWRLSANLDTDNVQTNESVTLTVTLSGEGNVGFLPAPEVRVPPDIELYEPEINVSKRAQNGTLNGRKTFTYLLIPRRPGAQEIPPVEISVFDPARNQYRTLKASPGTLNVSPATGWTAAEVDGSGVPAPVESVGREVRWIMDTAPSLQDSSVLLHERAEYWASFLLPVMLLLGGYALRRKRDSMVGQETMVRSRKAAKAAIDALKQARQHLASENIEHGYDALALGVSKYLADRLAVPSATLDEKTRTRYLVANQVSESSHQELQDIFSICDSARFSPHGSDAVTLANLIERTENWITTIDRRLKPVQV